MPMKQGLTMMFYRLKARGMARFVDALFFVSEHVLFGCDERVCVSTPNRRLKKGNARRNEIRIAFRVF